MTTQAPIAPRRVAIVGAGPSGLVAAKSLLHDHPRGTFSVHIFEKSSSIGGLWPLSTKDVDGLINPEMCTNQSRHTVAFSDLAWDEGVGMFPKAWQVGEYLKRYMEKYLIPMGVEVKTGWEVVKAVRESERKWSVVVKEVASGNQESESRKSETLDFDHLVVATGFFGEPKVPKAFSSAVGSGPRIIHSSKFRNVEDLLLDRKPGKIVVVGGQMSGVEVAASVATQLSSEVWSPGPGKVPDAEKFEIHHVISRPLWIMPLYLPTKSTFEVSADDNSSPSYNPATPFLPLDLTSNDLSKRPPGPLKNTSGRIEVETAVKSSQLFIARLGSNQSELAGDALAIRGEITEKPAWIAVSDSYNEFVRSGNIKLHTGRMTDLDKFIENGELRTGGGSHDKTTDLSKITVTGEDGNEDLENVAAIILTSGFDANSSLSFLPDEILQTLQFDPTCDPFPIDLHCHSTVHKSIPDLGFVGFYRSPYWGVMEMQARFLGNLWTGATDTTQTLDSDDSIARLRKCYVEEPERFAQFPMGDYAFLMESFAGANGIKRTSWPVGKNADPESRTGLVLPQRYSYDPPSNPEISKAISSIERTLDGAERGTFVSRAIMRALQGQWKVSRRFQSRDSLNPSGNFEGIASLHPRTPTESKFDLENLYVEEGNFTTDTGFTFKANRRYVHRYHEPSDKLSIWFVKTDDVKSVDYLFHEIEILPPEEDSGWRGKAYHWCDPDKYHVEYEFRFQGVGLKEWRMEYTVKGPKKDYTISSTYRR